MSELNKNREPILMACEEKVPAPPQSVISRVETFISGIQGHRDEAQNPEGKANPLQKTRKLRLRGEEKAEKEQPNLRNRTRRGQEGGHRAAHVQRGKLTWLSG
ncbi:MAG: hypothetical protein GY696_31095 [Gammaproteobacteria bacterium]|nr:hypothetical protein [Gammaproteobacteria bacterium]